MNAKHQWFKIDERLRFVAIGLINTVIRYLLFIAAGMLIGIRHYQYALIASWFLSSFTAFLGYKLLVFQSSGSHLKEYGKSVLIWTVSYFINALMLSALVGKLSINAYLAQGLSITVLTVINYLLFKHFAFRPPQKTFLEKIYNLWE